MRLGRKWFGSLQRQSSEPFLKYLLNYYKNVVHQNSISNVHCTLCNLLHISNWTFIWFVETNQRDNEIF